MKLGRFREYSSYYKDEKSECQKTLTILETMEIALPLNTADRLDQSITAFAQRKTTEIVKELHDRAFVLGHDGHHRKMQLLGEQFDISLPLAQALPKWRKSLSKFRDEMQSRFPVPKTNEDPIQTQRCLIGRELFAANQGCQQLERIFERFTNVCVESYRTFEQTHVHDKNELILQQFPENVQSIITSDDNGSFHKYKAKVNEIRQRWIYNGGNPMSPEYPHFCERELQAEYVAPEEIEQARDKYHSTKCICFRSKTQQQQHLAHHNLSFGFTAEQITSFHPTIDLTDNFPVIWKIVTSFEQGDFSILEKHFMSTHTVLRANSKDFTHGVTAIHSYHETTPIDIATADTCSIISSLQHWFTVSIGCWLMTLPGIYLINIFALSPQRLVDVIRAHIVKKLKNVSHAQQLPVYTEADGKTKTFPANLAQYAPEFAWIKDRDDITQANLIQNRISGVTLEKTP